MSRNKLFSFLVILVVGLALSPSARGQATTSLRGAILDPSGAGIPNATVRLANSDTGFERTTLSNSEGSYLFLEVLPGNYSLDVDAKGFKKYHQTNIKLLVQLPLTINVQMKVGSASETVTVTEQAPIINRTDATLGQTLGSNAIQNLPIQAENTVLLLSLQPGVVFNGENMLQDNYDTRAGAVNGERGDQNNITLDGVDNNDQFSGYAFNGILPTTPFSVEEFRVTTSNYGATQGRSAGAQISMVTKSGTNQFHGSLYEFNRNTIGEANDYFLKTAQLLSGQPNSPPHLVRNIFGGTVGGPFMKDRFFFFFNYEGQRQSLAGGATRTIPSATLRDGIIEYNCTTPSDCPGGSVTGASGNSYPVAAGMYALGPTQLAQLDPLGIGPSSVALAYFNSYPMPTSDVAPDSPNYASYTFAAPSKFSNNWYIARLDYRLTQNGNHTLFFRGTGVDDRSANAPFLPGQAPEQSIVDLSKGIVAGYTGVFGSHWVNNFRYGLTRASYGTLGNSSQPWVLMRDLDQGITRSSTWVSPAHNVADSVNWIKGSHTFQFGTNILFVRALSTGDGSSFSDALTNADWVDTGGFAGTSSPLNPSAGGFPTIASSSYHSYDFPLAAMMGIASELDARYNYHIDSLTSATPLAQGAPVTRHWATDTYMLFFQDTWHARPNLSITYGINYQLMTPVTETAGQQVAPTVNQGTWFNNRAYEGANGIPSNQDALITFSPAGSYWNGPGLYSKQTKNFAPRLGIAWSPNPSWGWLKALTGENKTSVRAGFGMYFDNFGPELAMTYNATGAFGVSTALENPAATLSVADAPRITSMNEIPTSDNNGNVIMPPAPPASFPVTYPQGAEAIAHGIDPSLKTPYSYALDLSIQRELPGHMTLDVAYVGHLGHHLLAYDDIATPLDLVDPKTGIDYFAAASRFSQLARAGTPASAITPALVGPTASYWTDMFVAPTGGASYNSCASGAPSVLVASYDWFNCFLYNETLSLWEMDVRHHYPLPVGGENSYYNGQYSSLWDWRSIGKSNYNALQVGLHRQMSQGLLFGFNYTYSKAMDIQSMSERAVHYLTSSIINPWSPNQMYGPSDFDLRHQINYYWVAELPFGHGKRFGSSVNNWADALIGGWQLSGTGRWTSGFVASVFQGYVWPTNWDEMGWSNMIGPVQTGTTNVNVQNTGFTPNVFKDPVAAASNFDYAYPGQSGQRNNVRGDGYFGLDMSLQKTWKIPSLESQSLQFRWNVFNVLNTTRFDVYSMQDEVDAGPSFGDYTSTLTNPRVMEFSLVYRF
jgi:Carboxypeptidase regulatory-like domain